MSNHLHIVSFNVPYPPDYGGVMDVFYKMKALHDLDVKIHLHCFEYGRKESEVLNDLCDSVNYYKRELSYTDFLRPTPYITVTRRNSELLKNMSENNYPILFEGLHTCYFLDHEELKDRVKAVRMHNVEWDYYRQLGKNESSMLRRFYFFTESIKLKSFEKILSKADHLLPISLNDYDYLSKLYDNVTYMPAFHPNEKVISLTGKGNYVLYHGNLSVAENNQAAIYLVSKVFTHSQIKYVIAGNDPSDMLVALVKKNPHIELRINPGEVEMMRLIKNAHVNILPTFQSTGTKLKLLNALFNGRFLITNSMMVENTGLKDLCIVYDEAEEIKSNLEKIMQQEFLPEEILRREKILYDLYSNKHNAEKLLPLLFAVSS